MTPESIETTVLEEELPVENPLEDTTPATEEPVLDTSPVPVEPMEEEIPAPAVQAVPEAPISQKKKRKKPNLGVRILLKIATWLICLALTVSLSATALVLDVRQVTKGENLRATLTAILTPKKNHSSPRPMLGAAGASTSDAEETLPEINTEEILAEVTSTTSADSLFDTVFDSVTEQYEGEMNITREQAQELYQKSTLPEVLADKLASCTEDILNGTDNTRITDEEILAFMDNNAGLIQDIFGKEVDDELKQKVLDFAKEAGLETLLSDHVVSKISQFSLGGDITVDTLLAQLRKYTSTTTLLILIGMDLLLAALLYLTNWLRLGATLRSIGVPMITVGAALSAPILLIDLLFTPENPTAYAIAHALVGPVTPVHYGMLGGGIVLLIAGIIVGIVSKAKAQ